MEFNEDPFQNSTYRYGDPFELSGGINAEPEVDPFTASVTEAFVVNNNSHHPFGEFPPASHNHSSEVNSNYSHMNNNNNRNSRIETFLGSDPFGAPPFAPLPTPTNNANIKNNNINHGKYNQSTSHSNNKAVPPDNRRKSPWSYLLPGRKQKHIQGSDEDLQRASEASKRAEDDRMQRLKLQEEQDIAYAIALSKAEAAYLKQ